MKSKDPLLWAVRHLHTILTKAQHRTDAMILEPIESLLAYQRLFHQTWERVQKAQRHRWFAASRQTTATLMQHAIHLRNCLDALLRIQPVQQAPHIPTWGFLLDELRQLQQEFGDVLINPKCSLIAVMTQPIRLQGRYFGPFQIELYLDRLTDRLDSSAFDCVAQDPQPATNNEEVTHPHVKSNTLCTGEATMPIQAALRQGRMADAFTLINSVLNAYNSGSPYVSLDDWDGISCGDCGASTDPDELFTCQACESSYCEHCISSCEICDQSICTSCLEREANGRRQLCPSCRIPCSRCGGMAVESEVDDAGICRHCREEDQPENDHEPELDDEPENDHEPHANDREQHADQQDTVPVPAPTA